MMMVKIKDNDNNTNNKQTTIIKQTLKKQVQTHLASRKMSLRSSEALNMNILECILISVMAEGGSECPTATRPTFW